MYFVLLSILRYDLKSINEYSLLNILYQWTAEFFNLRGVVTEVTFFVQKHYNNPEAGFYVPY